MGALTREEARVALEADADVVAWREDFVRRAARAAARVHVKLDTGMGRLGTKDVEEARARRRAPAGDVAGRR